MRIFVGNFGIEDAVTQARARAGGGGRRPAEGRKTGPFGGAIAQGLVSRVWAQICRGDGVRTALGRGITRMRLVSPMRVAVQPRMSDVTPLAEAVLLAVTSVIEMPAVRRRRVSSSPSPASSLGGR